MSLVTEHLRKRGVPFDVIPHAKSYTSIDEAKALGIDADEVLKTIVLNTASGHVLAVVPGPRRLDMKLVQKAVGDKHARFATEEELQRDFPGLELGAFPPLGSALGCPTYVDPEVLSHTTVVFAGGTQTDSVKARTDDLFRDEPIVVAPLAHRRDESLV